MYEIEQIIMLNQLCSEIESEDWKEIDSDLVKAISKATLLMCYTRQTYGFDFDVIGT